MPKCEKTPLSQIGQCPSLDLDGTVSADCSQENFMSSICAFSCPTGYTLIGPSTTECLEELEWSNGVPSWYVSSFIEYES